jgi:hypothetical protein
MPNRRCPGCDRQFFTHDLGKDRRQGRRTSQAQATPTGWQPDGDWLTANDLDT